MYSIKTKNYLVVVSTLNTCLIKPPSYVYCFVFHFDYLNDESKYVEVVLMKRASPQNARFILKANKLEWMSFLIVLIILLFNVLKEK